VHQVALSCGDDVELAHLHPNASTQHAEHTREHAGQRTCACALALCTASNYTCMQHNPTKKSISQLRCSLAVLFSAVLAAPFCLLGPGRLARAPLHQGPRCLTSSPPQGPPAQAWWHAGAPAGLLRLVTDGQEQH
jgi:hypothetical protein